MQLFKKEIKNRVLILHNEGNFFNNPSLKCIIDELLARNITVDIRYHQNFFSPSKCSNVRLLPYGIFLELLRKFLSQKLCSSFLLNILMRFENLLLFERYQLVLAIDRQGLVEAAELYKIDKTPYVFLSFEIFFLSETSRKFKALEIQASQNVEMWIVQDSERAACLIEENYLSKNNCFILPLASEAIPTKAKVRLRDVLGISKEKKVAMMMGSLEPWSMADEIINSVKEWTDNWVLLIHHRYGFYEHIENLLGDKNKHLLNTKIFISRSSSNNVDDMSEILAGIDVGLAFYKPDYSCKYTGKNIKHIGMSSGKISTFLRNAVPVIINDIGLYAEYLNQYNFGVQIDLPCNLNNAFLQIDADNMKEQAQLFYNEQLNFEKYKQELFDQKLMPIITRCSKNK